MMPFKTPKKVVSHGFELLNALDRSLKYASCSIKFHFFVKGFDDYNAKKQCQTFAFRGL